MSPIDDYVFGKKPLSHRLAESIFMMSMIAEAYRDGTTVQTVRPEDTNIHMLIPQGCLAYILKPFCELKPYSVGMLHFEQGEKPDAEWHMDVYKKSDFNVMTLAAKELSQKYHVKITAALAEKPF